MANISVKDCLKVADVVLNTPSITIDKAFSMFGFDEAPKAKDIITTILLPDPLFLLGRTIIRKKKEAEEKERMKNEIISKHQAVIDKLHREIELNRQEIQNLSDTLEMLEGVLSKVEAIG